GHAGSVSGVAFGPDGSWLATVGWDETLRLWSLPAGREVARVTKAHDEIITSLATNPDGTMLATAGLDNKVRLWDVTRPVVPVGRAASLAWPWRVLRLRNELTGPPHGARGIAFSPDGKTLATGGNDGAVKLWDTKTGHELATLGGHRREVWAVAFS